MCLQTPVDPSQVLLLPELPRQVRELQTEDPSQHETESPGQEREGRGEPGGPGLVAAGEYGLQPGEHQHHHHSTLDIQLCHIQIGRTNLNKHILFFKN